MEQILSWRTPIQRPKSASRVASFRAVWRSLDASRKAAAAASIEGLVIPDPLAAAERVDQPLAVAFAETVFKVEVEKSMIVGEDTLINETRVHGIYVSSTRIANFMSSFRLEWKIKLDGLLAVRKARPTRDASVSIRSWMRKQKTA